MSVFVFAVGGSIKHKTSDLFCVKRYSALSADCFFNFWNISKHVDLCHEIFTDIFNWISFCGGDRKISVLC